MGENMDGSGRAERGSPAMAVPQGMGLRVAALLVWLLRAALASIGRNCPLALQFFQDGGLDPGR